MINEHTLMFQKEFLALKFLSDFFIEKLVRFIHFTLIQNSSLSIKTYIM